VYTYTETTINEKGNSTTTVYAMKQVEFTNLNAIVYTMDGINFNTDEATLIRGEYLAIEDTTSLLGGEGEELYNSLSDFEKMDANQERRTQRDSVILTISYAGEAGGVPGSLVGAIAGGIKYIDQIVSGEMPRDLGPKDAWAIAGMLPVAGTITGAIDVYNDRNYKPSFSPYNPVRKQPQNNTSTGKSYGPV